MRLPPLAVAACVLLLATAPAGAGPLPFAGYLETRHAVQVKSPHEFLASETRLRLETEGSRDEASFFASVNASENHIDEESSEVRLHEGYLDYAGDGWDVRAGRQIIIWGNSDGLQVTDVLCPSDLTEYATRDLDEIRMPIDAVNLRYTGSGDLTIETVLIPFFEPAKLPEADSPWRVGTGPDPTPTEPEKTLENGEVGVRASWFLPGVDLTFSWARLWNDLPAQVAADTDPEPLGYRRTSFAGMTVSVPLGSLVVRGEAAWFSSGSFPVAEQGAPDIEKPLIKALAGCDWYPGEDWTFTVQALGEHIVRHNEDTVQDETRGLLTLRVAKKLFREKLELSNMGYVTLNDQDLFNRFEADYEIKDGFHAMAGADLFAGTRSGIYGRYKDNTQIWVKAKYSF
ncbi:DUF1302 family protein [Desulfoluna spongiiphila]|uniref:DUF1302 family protein n=1 Tax=Desulfoluna spongiiphila TaxID=419481 RepID=UPI001254B920|nr:DUF1302 family protein [Desulfoluna spongiiphila]VVS94534.1 consensus disorder prediction [Desulfoluna spongiiphila]